MFDGITVGWGRKISYCVAFSTDGATDVTRRYVRDFAAYGSNRSQTSEEAFIYILREIQTLRRARLDEQGKLRLLEEDRREDTELQLYIARAITRNIIDRFSVTNSDSSANEELLIKSPAGMFLPLVRKWKLIFYTQEIDLKVKNVESPREKMISHPLMKIHIIS